MLSHDALEQISVASRNEVGSTFSTVLTHKRVLARQAGYVQVLVTVLARAANKVKECCEVACGLSA